MLGKYMISDRPMTEEEWARERATVIDAEVQIGQDTVIAPFSSIHGETRIGERCTIGPHATLIDVIFALAVSGGGTADTCSH